MRARKMMNFSLLGMLIIGMISLVSCKPKQNQTARDPAFDIRPSNTAQKQQLPSPPYPIESFFRSPSLPAYPAGVIPAQITLAPKPSLSSNNSFQYPYPAPAWKSSNSIPTYTQQPAAKPATIPSAGPQQVAALPPFFWIRILPTQLLAIVSSLIKVLPVPCMFGILILFYRTRPGGRSIISDPNFESAAFLPVACLGLINAVTILYSEWLARTQFDPIMGLCSHRARGFLGTSAGKPCGCSDKYPPGPGSCLQQNIEEDYSPNNHNNRYCGHYLQPFCFLLFTNRLVL